MSETTGEDALTESQEGDRGHHAEELSTTTAASSDLVQPVATAVDGASSVDIVVDGDQSAEAEAPAVPDRPPVGRVRFRLDSDNQTRMVTTCNCSESGTPCAHIQIRILRMDVIMPTDDVSTRQNQQKSFAKWLTDEDHFEDHLMFLICVAFAGSMTMVLTFAWLEIDAALANVSWPFAAPVVLLLATQSCLWGLAAIYALWLYPKAYLQWKTEPPRRSSHTSARHRNRRRRRRRLRRRLRYSESNSPETVHRSPHSESSSRHTRSVQTV